jgi:surface polysaccharide O-acyltransferase-like enzyme
MSPTSYRAPPAQEHVATKRNASLDRTRTFLTIVVLIHHAVIPYTYFGHTDGKFWVGFDAVVLATDSFFMAMFFFLSGLFVWPSLSHKTPGSFFRGRVLRLGLPFAVAAFTIIPIAYYAIELRHSNMSFPAFWWKTVTVGPWPSGPLWFLWVLLAFDLSASLLYRVSPHLLDPINRLSVRGRERPVEFFLFFLAITMILYVPSRVYFGPNHWFEFGPFAVQASRVLLYAAYFFIGAGIGAANFGKGLLSPEGRLANGEWGWIVAAFIPYCLLWVLIYIKREILGNPDVLPDWYEASYGIFFAAFSAAILFAIQAYFLRFKQAGWSVLDPMQRDAYGIFLVHYAFALWVQYWLFEFDLTAITKVLMGFTFTLVASWMLTALLRKVPGASRVL